MNREGGWIASFLVIGALLLAGLVAGVIFLKSGKDNSTQTSDEITVIGDQDTSTDSKKKSDGATAEDRKKSLQASDTDKDQAADKKSDTSSATKSESDTQVATKNSSDEQKLPTTGPAENFASLIAVMALVFAGSSYVISRKHRSL